MRSDDPAWVVGKAGEAEIKQWLQTQFGMFIVPLADIQRKGAPLLEGLHKAIVLPDFQVTKGGWTGFVELATKRTATLHRCQPERWEHGKRRSQWEAYRTFEKETGLPGWLCIYELEPYRLVLLQRLAVLERSIRYYDGVHMPDGAPHVFFDRRVFLAYPGPASSAIVPLEIWAERTRTQPPPPMLPVACGEPWKEV